MTRIGKAIFILTLLSTLFFLSFDKPHYRLLVFATVNDSLTLTRHDTNWLADTVCIKLNIDTIDLSLISKGKSKDVFIYNKQSFLKTQLFELSEYDNLKTYEITRFAITQNFKVDPFDVKTNSNCLTNEQINRIRLIYKMCRDCNNKVTAKIYFSDIVAKNQTQKEIKLNNVSCLLN